MLLREEISFPSEVAGPFDLAPLAREAAICLGVLIRDFSMHGGPREIVNGVSTWLITR